MAWVANRRKALLIACAVGLVAIAAETAWAAATGSTTYTGCLSAAGAISNVAQGAAPLGGSCPAGSTRITIAGGDITSANAGIGLTGGATSGDATLSLAPSYRLPQICTDGQVAKWRTASVGWRCAADLNTTHSGSDFALSNQSCPKNQAIQGVGVAGTVNCSQTIYPIDFVLNPPQPSGEVQQQVQIGSLLLLGECYGGNGIQGVDIQMVDNDGPGTVSGSYIYGNDTQGTTAPRIFGYDLSSNRYIAYEGSAPWVTRREGTFVVEDQHRVVTVTFHLVAVPAPPGSNGWCQWTGNVTVAPL